MRSSAASAPMSLIADPKPVIGVILTNRHATFNCDPDDQAELKTVFRYMSPGCQFSAAYRNGEWDGYKNMLQRGRVSSGLFLERMSVLEKKFDLRIQDRRTAPEFRVVDDPGARPYQVQALEAMVQASTTGGLVICATGSGKTRLAGALFRSLVGNGLFVVDELTLLQQSKEEISSVLGEEVGQIGNSRFEPERITVATIQTLHRHRRDSRFRRWFDTLEVIIIDEIHVAINRRNVDVINTVKPLAVFGLTATLQLQKPEVRFPVTALAGPVIFEYPIQDGVDEGYLTRGKICFVEFRDPLKKPTPGYWTDDGRGGRRWIPPSSPASEYRYRISLNKARNNCIEKITREALKRGRRVIILCEQIVHLRILSARFKNVNHRVLSGNEELSGKSGNRLKALRDMDAGKINLLIASRVFGKGVNVRTVDTIIDATAKPGADSAIQRYGRGVRKAEGKEELLYVDISDRGNKFGTIARLRAKALMETGGSVMRVTWNGDPTVVFGSDEYGNVPAA